MKHFSNLVCFEFSKYSSCFEAIQNMDPDFFVFEVSPTPVGGILILVSNDAEKLSDFRGKQKLTAADTLIDSCFIKDANSKTIEAYLSQNQTEKIQNLNFFEADSLCQGFLYAQKITETQSEIIDFRVLRSIHNRSVIVYSGNKIDEKSVRIASPNDTVKDYFLIRP